MLDERVKREKKKAKTVIKSACRKTSSVSNKDRERKLQTNYRGKLKNSRAGLKQTWFSVKVFGRSQRRRLQRERVSFEIAREFAFKCLYHVIYITES